MRVTKKQKAMRLLAFLIGLGNRRIQALLVPFGLTQAVIMLGHQLLQRATQATLAPKAAAPTQVTAQLDVFENLWFPIARASLARRFPLVGAWLFANLVQTHGIDLVVSVGTLVRRIEKLASGTSEFGTEGQQAVALLAERGLNAEVLNEVQQLLSGLQVFDPEDSVAQEALVEEAEAAMWAWYLEWSTIARAVIKDRRLLKALGFLKSSRSGVQGPTDTQLAAGDFDSDDTDVNDSADSALGTDDTNVSAELASAQSAALNGAQQ